MQRDSQKTFKSTRRHHLPWIYCSNTHCTMVLWQKCGIFTLNFITGVKVYNYSKYVWLSYSMCAFILNVFRLLFFIQIGYTVKNCCKIYSDLLAILVASKTVNLQKFCKSIITIVL